MPEQDLEPEIAEFERLKDHLREQYGPDEWVVISLGALQGHFSKFGDAALFAVSNFQDCAALVRQVESPPVHVPYILMRAQMRGHAPREVKVINLDVEIRIRCLLPGGSVGFAAVDSIGVIDTGADRVLIPRSFAKKLGLRPINQTIAVLASGEKRSAITYLGVLEIPDIGYSAPLEMTAMTEGGEAHHVLLGRNFLREFLVTIDCSNNVCWFTRPTHPSWQMVDDE